MTRCRSCKPGTLSLPRRDSILEIHNSQHGLVRIPRERSGDNAHQYVHPCPKARHESRGSQTVEGGLAFLRKEAWDRNKEAFFG